MPRISESTIREVFDRMDALAIIGDYVRLENKGGRFWGCCPFHNEKTPSFTVDPDKKLYHCFGCGEGGGVVNFIMNIDKLSYPEAIEQIARKSGIEIIYENTNAPNDMSANRKHADDMRELYERVAKSFNYILTKKDEGRRALDYLKNRGISKTAIERFNLGYAPADRRWLHSFLSKKSYSAQFLIESGLFSKNYQTSAFFSDRLMFPIHNRDGQCVAFGGRLLDGDGPKYLNSPESEIFRKRDSLYALDFALPEIRRTKEVILVEGYMDVIAMHEAGITNTVAPLGTSFTEDQAKLLKRYAERALLFFDADDAGQKAAEKAILLCQSAGLDCRVIAGEAENEKFKDPDEILQKKGANYLKKLTTHGIMPMRYLVERSRVLFDLSDPHGKQKALASLFPYIKTLDSELLRSDALLMAADAFLSDSAVVTADYRAWLASGKTNYRQTKTMESPERTLTGPVRLSDELFLLTTVLANIEAHPEFFTCLRVALSIDEIYDIYAKELYIAMEEWLRMDGFGGIADICSRIKFDSLRLFVTEKCSGSEFIRENAPDAERLFNESLHTVQKQKLEAKRKLIVQKLRLLGNAGGEETESLLEEKMYIDRELRAQSAS